MAERIEISTGHAGADAPDQPIYEGFTTDEPEAPTQGGEEQDSEQAFEVPDKFMREDGSVDVEALAKSYAELERGISSTPDSTEESTPEGFPLTQEEMESYGKELSDNGSLSDEAYNDMAAKGLPRDVVDQYIAGQQAIVAQQREQFLSSVGGEENYDVLTEWANSNLTESEVNAYDAVMNGGDPVQMQMALQGLSARHQQATGRPNLLKGNTGSMGSAQGYRSWAEVTSDMKNPKYQTDPAYRQDVQNRLEVSDLG
jgi:hypothetical protein